MLAAFAFMRAANGWVASINASTPLVAQIRCQPRRPAEAGRRAMGLGAARRRAGAAGQGQGRGKADIASQRARAIAEASVVPPRDQHAHRAWLWHDQSPGSPSSGLERTGTCRPPPVTPAWSGPVLVAGRPTASRFGRGRRYRRGTACRGQAPDGGRIPHHSRPARPRPTWPCSPPAIRICFGVGTRSWPALVPDEGGRPAIPAASAFALARSRLAWEATEVTELSISLCGRPLDGDHAACCSPGHALLAAVRRPPDTPRFPGRHVAGSRGLGASNPHHSTSWPPWADPAERDPPHQCRRVRPAMTLHALNTSPRWTVATEPGARIPHLATGLPDALFEHDGQLTRREVRAVTLSSLAPRRGREAVGCRRRRRIDRDRVDAPPPRQPRDRHRARPSARRPHRRQRRPPRVPALHIVPGAAPAALAGLPTPDAGFSRRRRTPPRRDRYRLGRPARPMAGSSPTPSPSKPRPPCSTPGRASAARSCASRWSGWIVSAACTPTARHDRDPMVRRQVTTPAIKPLGPPMITAGLGCRRGCTADELVALIQSAGPSGPPRRAGVSSAVNPASTPPRPSSACRSTSSTITPSPAPSRTASPAPPRQPAPPATPPSPRPPPSPAAARCSARASPAPTPPARSPAHDRPLHRRRPGCGRPHHPPRCTLARRLPGLPLRRVDRPARTARPLRTRRAAHRHRPARARRYRGRVRRRPCRRPGCRAPAIRRHSPSTAPSPSNSAGWTAAASPTRSRRGVPRLRRRRCCIRPRTDRAGPGANHRPDPSLPGRASAMPPRETLAAYAATGATLAIHLAAPANHDRHRLADPVLRPGLPGRAGRPRHLAGRTPDPRHPRDAGTGRRRTHRPAAGRPSARPGGFSRKRALQARSTGAATGRAARHDSPAAARTGRTPPRPA